MRVALVLLGLLSATAHADEPAKPAQTDDEVWSLAQKVGTSTAYEKYWNLFPQGTHASEAMERFRSLERRPLVAPPPPRMVVPSVITPTVPGSFATCPILTVNQAVQMNNSGEAQDIREAERSNRVAAYRDYLARYPQGVCRERAEAIIRLREQRRALFSRIPGFGPLAPHARGRNIFGDLDYPAASLAAGEQGRVTAEWDVAEDGIAESCRVTQSSGSQRLDETTCRLILRRMRYDPARDANGEPMRSTDHMTVNWLIPKEGPEPAPPNAQVRP